MKPPGQYNSSANVLSKTKPYPSNTMATLFGRKRPRLFRHKRVRPDPEPRQRLQIALVCARNSELLSPFDAKYILTRAPGLYLFNEGTVHQNGAMNSYESVRFELLRHCGDRLPEQIGTRVPLQQHIVALSLDSRHVRRIDKEDPSLCLDGDFDRLRQQSLKLRQDLHQTCRALALRSADRHFQGLMNATG